MQDSKIYTNKTTRDQLQRLNYLIFRKGYLKAENI